MAANLLVLGGTQEATTLCSALAKAGMRARVSLAGRVKTPAPQDVPMRVGGFGGADGLADYLRAERITHVIDATHPFAAQMSRNAVTACAQLNLPLLAFTRAPWVAQEGDNWCIVGDIEGAVQALEGPAARVMLAVGRMHLEAFAPNQQHFYLLRLVDAPDSPLPFADHQAIIARGPFTYEDDLALMRDHRIDVVVAKNAGGSGARAKIDAARILGLPVIMIDRPAIPQRAEATQLDDVLRWLDHGATDRGV